MTSRASRMRGVEGPELEAVRAVVSDYHRQLDMGFPPQMAAITAVDRIADVLKMRWVRGKELKARERA